MFVGGMVVLARDSNPEPWDKKEIGHLCLEVSGHVTRVFVLGCLTRFPTRGQLSSRMGPGRRRIARKPAPTVVIPRLTRSCHRSVLSIGASRPFQTPELAPMRFLGRWPRAAGPLKPSARPRHLGAAYALRARVAVRPPPAFPPIGCM